MTVKRDVKNIGKSGGISGKNNTGGPGGMGQPQTKTTHKLFNLEKDVKVTFDQVAG